MQAVSTKIAALLPKSGTARLVREDAQSPLSAITCSRGQNQTCLETTEQTACTGASKRVEIFDLEGICLYRTEILVEKAGGAEKITEKGPWKMKAGEKVGQCSKFTRAIRMEKSFDQEAKVKDGGWQIGGW